MKYPILLRTTFLCLLIPFFYKSYAQCSNWGISAQVITTSTCAASGSFSVSLTGNDVANLTNIQYGIPTAANNFSVPLNNAPLFNSIPPGTYTVTATAVCGGNFVGKNTTVTIPGGYIAPSMTVTPGKKTLTCAATGSISCFISQGRAPYTITLISAPAGYTGPMSFQTAGSFAIGSLPAGQYSLQMTDACGFGTPLSNITMGTLDFAAATGADFNGYNITNITCDSIYFTAPSIYLYSQYISYEGDTSIKVSAQIGGGILPATPYQKMYGGNGFGVKLPAGTTIKDCYGQAIEFTIISPCGNIIHKNALIQAPHANLQLTNHCNTSLSIGINLSGLYCTPVTTTARNIATNQVYSLNSLSNLPFTEYWVKFTTGDGYTDSTIAIPDTNIAAPYHVAVINGACGLNGFAEGFSFTLNNSQLSPGTTYIELYNGPPGYTYNSVAYGMPWNIWQNQAVTNGNINFPAGNYVWKITDNCGVYYLPVTVTQQDIFQFTAAIGTVTPTCNGTYVTPVGTATNNGQNINSQLRFQVLKNGNVLHDDSLTNPYHQSYAAGTPILLTQPGTYTFLPCTTPYACTYSDSVNPNSSYAEFIFTDPKLQIDVKRTQGFMCTGGSNGQAQIFTQATGGNPYNISPAYTFYLAHAGNGINGPYIDSNTTGVFTGFGGNANDSFDVKVKDGCGAYSTQRVKVLDMGVTRVISSTNYVFCGADSIVLSALYFPGATYSWTGPNGFTANQQQVTLYNITTAVAGVYHVTISTPYCSNPFSDSTNLIVNGAPPAPVIAYNCMPTLTLTITNPNPAYKYQWTRTLYPGAPYTYFYNSDSNYSIHPLGPRYYRAWTIDTLTGCKTQSNVYTQNHYADEPLALGLYAPHRRICTGDTLTLTAVDSLYQYYPYIGVTNNYQWYRDGLPIAGATNITYITSLPGHYKVSAVADVCNVDTSDEITIELTGIPNATLTAPFPDFCEGSTTTLFAVGDTSYTYSWIRDGISVPAAFSDTLAADQTGTYYIIVSNGGCIATSNSVQVTAHPAPNINLQPAANLSICPGETVHFTTTANTGYTYNWSFNGQLIANATANSYNTADSGTYKVLVSAPYCPMTPSQPVHVSILPTLLNLGADTSFCNEGAFSLPLYADTGFQSVLWSTGSAAHTITVSQSGLYWVRASNRCGSVSDSIDVHTIADYLPYFPADTTICNSQNQTFLTVSPLLKNIQWSNGSTAHQISVTAPGLYSVSGTSPCGTITDTVNVHFCRATIADIIPDNDTICEGDCINFSPVINNFPTAYRWHFEGGNTTSSSQSSPGLICYPTQGIYTVSLWISSPGGVDSFTRTIRVFSKPKPRFKDSTMTVTYKTLMHIPSCADAVTVDWYIKDSLVCSNCASLNVDARFYKTRYRCVVSNGDCADSCSYVLNVIDIPNDLWLPTAFTPNGDGRNDLFRIITDNPNISVMDFSVYNRWGQKVFGKVLSMDGWDGTSNGVTDETGTYFWMLRYKILGRGDIYFKKGDVTLVR